MKLLKGILILFVIFFISCGISRKDNSDPKLVNAIDTLSRLDYLFSIKEIPIRDNGIAKGEFSNVCTRDHHGNFYFMGYDQRVYKLDPSGKLIRRFEAIGHGPGEYISIEGIRTDEEGNIYLNNATGRNILKYDPDFNFLLNIKLKSVNPVNSFDIHRGKLICYHSSETDGAIFIYNSKTGEFEGKYGTGDQLENRFHSPNCASSLNIDGERCYYIHAHEYKIYELDESKDINTITPSTTGNFKVINKPSPDPFAKRDYSVIFDAILLKGLFFINVNPPDAKNEPGMNFDVVTREGSVLKKGLKFGDVWWLNKVDDKTLISLNYKKEQQTHHQVITLYTLTI